MAEYVRDPSHWLFKMSPDEWIRAALVELKRAETLYGEHNAKGGLAGARRAAGMALNGALIVAPDEAWGRSYIDHLRALAKDTSVPPAVQAACALLIETQPPGPTLVTLRSHKADERILEAARDVMAHAYAVVKRSEPLPGEP